jgi:hypothetical protein
MVSAYARLCALPGVYVSICLPACLPVLLLGLPVLCPQRCQCRELFQAELVYPVARDKGSTMLFGRAVGQTDRHGAVAVCNWAR